MDFKVFFSLIIRYLKGEGINLLNLTPPHIHSNDCEPSQTVNIRTFDICTNDPKLKVNTPPLIRYGEYHYTVFGFLFASLNILETLELFKSDLYTRVAQSTIMLVIVLQDLAAQQMKMEEMNNTVNSL